MRVALLIGVVFVLTFLPRDVGAQSVIAGLVTDTSGAVLPGVSVEAASPALIEKVRTAVTNADGRYSIVDIRPGTYAVTFTLPGFTTVRRTGIELRAEFTATVDIELQVGTVAETITVSGEAPLVDTRSARAQTQYAAETLQSLPGNGRLATLISVLPGAVLNNEGDRASGALSDRSQTRFAIHGAPNAQPVIDGMNTEMAAANTGVFVFNGVTFQEVVAETSGIGADRDTGPNRPNLTGDPMSGGGTEDRWFNATPIGGSGSAFSRPAVGTFGNLPRNSLVGPGYWRTDASLFKRFMFTSGHGIEVRAEAVNLFNHVNLGNPDSEIGVPGNDNPNAGRITSTAYFGADPMRNFQFAVKYIF